MNTTSNRKRFIAGAMGAAITGIAAPALLFLGAGTAQAMPAVSEANASTITTQRPGHIAIQVAPPLVSAPHVWGPFPSLEVLLAD
jgi:hypothetical protein